MNREWGDAFADFEPLADKLVLAGWATKYMKGENGIAFEWTPIGLERLKNLCQLRKDILDENFHPDRFKTLISIMRQEAFLQGWSEVL